MKKSSVVKVLKYKLSYVNTNIYSAITQLILLPCEILHVGEQFGGLYLWAAVDLSKDATEARERKFLVVPTGMSIKDYDGFTHEHLGTVLMLEGRLVLHVFEVK